MRIVRWEPSLSRNRPVAQHKGAEDEMVSQSFVPDDVVECALRPWPLVRRVLCRLKSEGRPRVLERFSTLRRWPATGGVVMASHKTQWPLLISSRLVRHDVQPSRVSVDDGRFTVNSSLFARRDRKGRTGAGGVLLRQAVPVSRHATIRRLSRFARAESHQRCWSRPAANRRRRKQTLGGVRVACSIEEPRGKSLLA